jgi:IclR family transcriptional regulator, KDG regulon repressor
VKRREAEVVKSVARVFDILELFDRRRRALTAAEVGRELRYPPSSTIGLLKSMVTLGYLAFDCVDFTYTPTLRLPMIGNWIKASGINGDIKDLMLRLHDDTGESVSLCTESDGRMQVLALSASKDIGTFSKVSAVGDYAPLFGSVVGLTSLSTRTDNCVMQVATNLLRRPRYLRPEINIPESLKHIRLFRESGFGVAYDLSTPNVGALAWAMASDLGKAPVVLGVWGPAARIRVCESRVIGQVTAALRPPACLIA